MDKENPDDVVVDAADAVTLSQDVQWERCARQATPVGRRALAKLRVLSRAFAGGHAAGPRMLRSLAAGPESYAGVYVRRFLGVVVGIAALEVAAALLLLPWMWGDYHRDHGDVARFLTIQLAGHAATACLLLLAGRREERTWLLGVYFLLRATRAPAHMFPAFFLELPAPDMMDAFVLDAPAATRFLGYLHAPPFLFAPAFVWAFARACPLVDRRSRLDTLAVRMVPVSVLLGCALWVACVASIELARAGFGQSAATLLLDAVVSVPNLSALAAVAVVALRARSAPADEARRVAAFSVGFLMFVGMLVAYGAVEVVSPGSWLSNYRWSPYVGAIELFRFPGMVLLWYSVLAVRVPDLREAVRASYRRLLLRGRLLGAAAAAPAVALGWLAASRPELTLGAVIADPLAQALVAATGLLLLVAACRKRILIRLDAWVYPETMDQRQALAAAAATLARTAQVEAVRRTVTRTVAAACGAPAALLVRTGAAASGAEAFGAPGGKVAPFATASAIVHLLDTGGGSLRVHPSDASSMFELLPPEDAAWVAEAAADAVVAVPGPGAGLIGVLVVGRRVDDRILRAVDIPFLETLAAAAGQAIARLRGLQAPSAPGWEAPPARECETCGCVTGAAEPAGCRCGSEYVETEVPQLLAGKFRLTRRLGTGGMGTVYVARDIRLQRDVAVKTLSGMSVARLMRLKPEAWTMATVTHAALAQIHGIESWRGRPFLVLEFLAGGTLADRLRQGPVPAPEAVLLTAVLTEALAALHAAGCLHGDIKPSNIGFTSDGSPKLLDFGLSREMDDTAPAGGTLHYASPELLSGRPAEEADDVWSLCVVLYEMVTGRRPFGGAGVEEVTDRILRRRIRESPRSGAGAERPSAAAEFAASLLAAARPARPATAREFAKALGRIPGQGN